MVALDSAEFGPVTITKSVAIVGSPGALAAICVVSGNGVTMATPGVDVVLRNLHISSACGSRGVDASAGRSVAIENSVVADFIGDGIRVSPVTENTAVQILNTVARGNGGHGAVLGGGVRASVANSHFMSNAGSGLFLLGSASRGTRASISDSVASSNGSHGFYSSVSSGAANRVTLVRATGSNNTGSGFHNETIGEFSQSHMAVAASMASANGIGFFNSFTNLISNSRFTSAAHNLVINNTQDFNGPATDVPQFPRDVVIP